MTAPLVEPPPLALKPVAIAATTPVPLNRCACCRKKLALTDFACGKCTVRHCALHRLPEQHACSHDYQAAGRAAIAAANPEVRAKKIDVI
jgi:hypothetical protein